MYVCVVVVVEVRGGPGHKFVCRALETLLYTARSKHLGTLLYITLLYTANALRRCFILLVVNTLEEPNCPHLEGGAQLSSCCEHTLAYVSIRQHTSAYVRGGIRQHASGEEPRCPASAAAATASS